MAATGVIEGFDLPGELEAAEPPEARGLRRDEVRLLVSDLEGDSIDHARFNELSRWLSPGDLLVVNTSGTLNAAIAAVSDDGSAFEIHLSTELPGGFWSVEVRRPGHEGAASLPFTDARAGTRFRLPAGGEVTLLAPYPLPRDPWRPHQVRLCEAAMASLDVSDRLRHRTGKRGDAVRRPAVHA